MAVLTPDAIRERLALIEDHLNRHEIACAYLRKDRERYTVALDVAETFDRWEPVGAELLPPATAELGAKETRVPRKPSGTPSVPQMIDTVLAMATIDDGRWLEPKEITAEIRTRWWPDAPVTSIGPIAWRMAQEGRLKKQGAAYTILQNETPAELPTGVSEREDADVDGSL